MLCSDISINQQYESLYVCLCVCACVRACVYVIQSKWNLNFSTQKLIVLQRKPEFLHPTVELQFGKTADNLGRRNISAQKLTVLSRDLYPAVNEFPEEVTSFFWWYPAAKDFQKREPQFLCPTVNGSQMRCPQFLYPNI